MLQKQLANLVLVRFLRAKSYQLKVAKKTLIVVINKVGRLTNLLNIRLFFLATVLLLSFSALHGC